MVFSFVFVKSCIGTWFYLIVVKLKSCIIGPWLSTR